MIERFSIRDLRRHLPVGVNFATCACAQAPNALGAWVVLDLKLNLTREGLPSTIRQVWINIGEDRRKAPGLSQPEKAGNEYHYDNNADYVENIIHGSFSFLSRERIYRLARCP